MAGALWIRADDFFHRGQYEAIIPIVRMVTWLDPHNIDVYITGAWHLDYNFVDEANSLSDKRYIPAAIALMREGIRNNPNIWDLYFELGWTHYSKKMNDNVDALKWISKACEHNGIDPNTGEKVRRFEFVDRMKAHHAREMRAVRRGDRAVAHSAQADRGGHSGEQAQAVGRHVRGPDLAGPVRSEPVSAADENGLALRPRWPATRRASRLPSGSRVHRPGWRPRSPLARTSRAGRARSGRAMWRSP